MVGLKNNRLKENRNNKKTLWPPFKDWVQLPQDYSHFEEAVYVITLSSQKFLVLVLSINLGRMKG